MKRLISAAAAAIIAIMLMLPFCTLYASAENTAAGWSGDSSLSCVIDNAGIFNDKSYVLEQLNSSTREYSEKLQMNICVFIAGPQYRMSDSDEVQFCKKAYSERFGDDTDGEDVDEILDASLCYLPSSDSFSSDTDYSSEVRTAINSFYGQLNEYQEDFRAGLKYYYDKNTKKYIYYLNGELKVTEFKPPAVYLKALLIAIVGGGIAHLITFFVAKSNYKFKAKTNPNIYLAKDETRFSVNNDELIRSHTSKTHIPQSSGGGGGGGFRSGGGGGGSFGGGGRHR